MATTLKKTGVVVVGMGGAGGLAALPLAQAGIDVIGLEAGSWLKTSEMIPDELGLRRTPWPPAAKVRGRAHQPPGPATANAARAQDDDEWSRRHDDALHGAAWRLNPWDFKVVS
jgi:choline dehydrogenase-like flavoprotein